ncbi:MBL fold metallo-hydrolase [Prolixibacteraceae bacterium JC049]|nr:MBL fold metallo-hydrolase [Prolixibacteraceae bacterium JC049]
MAKITVLVENTSGRRCIGEHGLSFLIEADKRILFDVGPSDAIIHNSVALKIPIHEVDTIVLSHGHDDHTNGLKYFHGQKLIAHPEAFKARFRKKNKTPLGINITREQAQRQFQLVETKEPLKISEEIYFLGEVPRNNNFEAQTTAFLNADGTPDFIPDDSGLALITPKGLVVISGCAHSGICNMVEHARKVTGQQKIHAVMGGFHLTENNEQTQKTIEFLKEQEVERVMPSHCTAFPALVQFYQNFPFNQLKSGNSIFL